MRGRRGSVQSCFESRACRTLTKAFGRVQRSLQRKGARYALQSARVQGFLKNFSVGALDEDTLCALKALRLDPVEPQEALLPRGLSPSIRIFSPQSKTQKGYAENAAVVWSPERARASAVRYKRRLDCVLRVWKAGRKSNYPTMDVDIDAPVLRRGLCPSELIGEGDAEHWRDEKSALETRAMMHNVQLQLEEEPQSAEEESASLELGNEDPVDGDEELSMAEELSKERGERAENEGRDSSAHEAVEEEDHWEQLDDGFGNKYYYNSITGESTWDPPPTMAQETAEADHRPQTAAMPLMPWPWRLTTLWPPKPSAMSSVNAMDSGYYGAMESGAGWPRTVPSHRMVAIRVFKKALRLCLRRGRLTSPSPAGAPVPWIAGTTVPWRPKAVGATEASWSRQAVIECRSTRSRSTRSSTQSTRMTNINMNRRMSSSSSSTTMLKRETRSRTRTTAMGRNNTSRRGRGGTMMSRMANTIKKHTAPMTPTQSTTRRRRRAPGRPASMRTARPAG